MESDQQYHQKSETQGEYNTLYNCKWSKTISFLLALQYPVIY